MQCYYQIVWGKHIIHMKERSDKKISGYLNGHIHSWTCTWQSKLSCWYHNIINDTPDPLSQPLVRSHPLSQQTTAILIVKSVCLVIRWTVKLHSKKSHWGHSDIASYSTTYTTSFKIQVHIVFPLQSLPKKFS